MSLVKLDQNRKPKIHDSCFVASSADIIGDVTLGEKSNVWFQCVLRGDVTPITVGERTNIQDGAIVHGTYGKWAVKIGNDVTVGHKAMLHGCEIGDQAFVGMGSILLDGSKMATRSFLAAGSLLTEGQETESEWMYMGRPAKALRRLRSEELEFLEQSAKNYLMYTEWYGTNEHG